MSKITRSDVFMKSEKGGDWFDDFLESLAAENKEAYTQEIIDTITNTKANTVEGVVSQYREMVGLDTIANDKDAEIKATASSSISIRQAKEKDDEDVNVVLMIEDDPRLKSNVESMCEHSGGTKDTHSILSFLREELGNELVSFSDQELIDYIKDIKEQYHTHNEDCADGIEGKVGLEGGNEYSDDTAEYMKNNGKG